MLEMAVSPRTAYPVAYTPFKDKAKDSDANADETSTGVSLRSSKYSEAEGE
jgi:hypothetical protein